MSPREPNDAKSLNASIPDRLRSTTAISGRRTSKSSCISLLDGVPLSQYRPEQILNRLLTTKSRIATTFSPTEHNQQRSDHGERQKHVHVGEGQCGTVWALAGTDSVLKISKPNKGSELLNDIDHHIHVYGAFRLTGAKIRGNFRVPKPMMRIEPSDKLWQVEAGCFPTTLEPQESFVSERIHPLPLPVREAIIDTLAPKVMAAFKADILAREENESCLIRLYLGRREQRSSTKAFKLRNFDLTISEMEFLGLDVDFYAQNMAKALAVLHWEVGIDANDVEFVLGSSPPAKEPSAGPPKTCLDFTCRSVSMWLLDFNQCKRFEQDPEGLELLTRGFYFNDPYYPRPVSANPKDVALWEVFRAAYLEASSRIVDSTMPKAFIEAVEAEGQRRKSAKSIFY